MTIMGSKRLVAAICGLVTAIATVVVARAAEIDLARYEAAVDQQLEKVAEVVKAGPYEPTWDSLEKHDEAPEWFRDAKFGIYFHWGVYSVPAYGTEWYPRLMHFKNRPEYRHHVETYGDPEEFGYHKFVPDFNAKHFDAEEWAELFKKAGAKYAGPVVEHHDGYAMWDSALTPWNTAETGPMRDITGEMAEAVKKQGMKFVTTFHHARHNLWQQPDGSWRGHYENIKNHFPSLLDDPLQALLYGYFPRDQFLDLWLAKLAEVIDKYQPDLLWFDAWLYEIPVDYMKTFTAYYLNSAAKSGQDVMITRKAIASEMPLTVSVEDFEKGRTDRLTELAWLTDDTISKGSWSYTTDLEIKSLDEVLNTFVDIVSKNGCLLLNISPTADGTIPADQREILLGMGEWLELNGEAIYNTRPWREYGEGPTQMEKSGHFVGDVQYTPQDIRYTRTKDHQTLYAITLGHPTDEQLVLSLVKVDNSEDGVVRMIGYDRELDYSLDFNDALVIDLPDMSELELPTGTARVFKLTGFEVSLNRPDISLRADEAKFIGDSIKTESLVGDSYNIGYWDDLRDSAHWLVNVNRAGKYRLEALVAAASTSNLNIEIISPAGRKNRIMAEIPSTGGWRERMVAPLGEIEFDQPGMYHVVARPAENRRWSPINLWNLNFHLVVEK